MMHVHPTNDARALAGFTRAARSVPFQASVVIVGLLLRVRYIADHYLWNDELSSMRTVGLSWAEWLEYFQTVEPHPPLSFFFFRVFHYLTFGIAPLEMVRFGNLVWFLVLAIGLVWLARRGPRVGVVASIGLLALCIGPSYAFLGAELRPYGLLLTVSVGLLLVSFVWLEDHWISDNQPNVRFIVALGALAAAAGVTHYAGVLIAASVIASMAMIGIARTKTLDRRLFGAIAVALALFIPVVPLLVDQLRIADTTPPTPLTESLEFLGWGVGPIGILLAVVALVGTIAQRSRDRTGNETPAGLTQSSIAVLGTHALLTAILLTGGIGITSAVRDLDLLNFGVSVVPSLFIVLGVAALAVHVSPQFAVVVAFLGALYTVPIALAATDDPALFRANRVPTVNVLEELVDETALGDHFGRDWAIISFDNNVTNEYLAQHAKRLLPLAEVRTLHGSQGDELGALLVNLLREGDSTKALLITRFSVETRVEPRIPHGFRLRSLGPNAVLVERSATT